MQCNVVPAGILFAALYLAPLAAQAATAGECRDEVIFQKGATSTQVKGKISGYGYCEYLLRAKKGQTLTVQSSSSKADIMLRGPVEQLLTDGEPVTLGADGVYTLRVLMPRAIARKNLQEKYSLDIAIVTPPAQTGKGAAGAVVPDGHNSMNSVDWPGYYYGRIPCASCPGIDTWLSLADTGKAAQYSLTENYLDEKDGYFQNQGAALWNKDGQTMQLKGAEETRVLFVAEAAVAFLAEGEQAPNDNGQYWLEKLDVFTGNQEMLLVSPSKVSVSGSGAKAVVSIQDTVMNFDHATDAGHRSLKTDLHIFCAEQKYTMPAIVYYQQPFAGGLIVDKGGNGEDRLDFAGPEDVVRKAADQYCE